MAMRRWLFVLLAPLTIGCIVFTLERGIAAARSDADCQKLVQDTVRLHEELNGSPSPSDHARLHEADRRVEDAVDLALERYHDRDFGFYALALLVPVTGWAYIVRRRKVRDEQTFGA